MSDPYTPLRSRLQAIYITTRRFVKQLRRINAHIMAGRFVNLGMQAGKLADRRDLLLPTYRRQVDRIQQQLEDLMNEGHQHYPSIIKLEKDAPLPDPADNPTQLTQTRRVSITLAADEWSIIDHRLSNGSIKSMAGYFRDLHHKGR